jgi:hypothetical protein
LWFRQKGKEHDERQVSTFGEEKDKQESEWGHTVYSIKWHKVFNKKNILRTQAWNSRYVFNNINQYTFKLSNGQESSEDFYNYKLNIKRCCFYPIWSI